MLLLKPLAGFAQNPPAFDPLAQLQISQPAIEIISNATATASFDPPIIRPDGQATYRVTFNALDDSIRWPKDVIAPVELDLHPSARGQVFPLNYKLIPLTSINYHVRATKPGTFTIQPFPVEVYGRRVMVPAATLVVTNDPAMPTPWAPTLELQVSETNIYAGQTIPLRITMAAGPDNMLQGLTQSKLNGEGFIAEPWTPYAAESIKRNGVDVAVIGYQSLFTSLVSGQVKVSAQAFTAGNQGPFIIRGNAYIPGGPPRYMLVDSDPVTINVKPLPRSGQLPGFNGAIGTFTSEPPLLLANRVRVGDVVKIEVAFRGSGNLARLVMPPPPQVPGWQIFPAAPGALPLTNRPPVAPSAIARFIYTMIPVTNGLTATPKIPFSYFDPQRSVYVDLSIPPVPLTVTPGAAPLEFPVAQETNTVATTSRKLSLSGLTTAPGRTTASLRPLQQQGWFIGVQIAPVLGLIALWTWDRRRRYLALHPDIMLRRRARRALRRERRTLERARRAGDVPGYAASAVNAMRVACAPHYPAEPRALVCRDVLELFEETERGGTVGEVVRKIFSFADAAWFAGSKVETNGLLALHPEVNRVLEKLEARL